MIHRSCFTPAEGIDIETYDDPELTHPYYWTVYHDTYSMLEHGHAKTRFERMIKVAMVYLRYRFGRGKA
jgi:hypothetical protein